jgi:hypothetical protein
MLFLLGVALSARIVKQYEQGVLFRLRSCRAWWCWQAKSKEHSGSERAVVTAPAQRVSPQPVRDHDLLSTGPRLRQ